MNKAKTKHSFLTGIRLAIPWEELGFPALPRFDGIDVTSGAPAWTWDGTPPDLGVPDSPPVAGEDVEGWNLDHIVLLVPNLETAVTAIAGAGHSARLTMEVKGRPTAFFRVGTVLEVIETRVPFATLYGLALATSQPLDEVAASWRRAGFDAGEPHDAIQPGRSIFSVADLDAGLAVMTPDNAAAL